MLKIGDFSRIAQVSIKTLHFYDQCDLFKPAHINPDSGYRFYTLDQLPKLNRIVALKELGLSLEQIGLMLKGELSAEELRGMLHLKQAELKEALKQTERQLSNVANRLYLIEQENTMPDYEIVIKEIPVQKVLSIRKTLISSAEIESLFIEVGETLAKHSIQSAGAWLALYHHEGVRSENLDFELAVPVKDEISPLALNNGQELRMRRIEKLERVATVIEDGHKESWGESYAQLGRWLEDHNCEIVLPTREVFLTSPDAPEGWIVEIQFPVKERPGFNHD